MVCLTTSYLRQFSTFFSPVTFLTSHLSLPTEMLQSQRTLLSPSAGRSMAFLIVTRSSERNCLASEGDEMSGSVTISTSGMPLLL